MKCRNDCHLDSVQIYYYVSYLKKHQQHIHIKCYFLLLTATDVVTVYVFQEPSLLSSLQDNGLTDVVLHALLIKDVSTYTKN